MNFLYHRKKRSGEKVNSAREFLGKKKKKKSLDHWGKRGRGTQTRAGNTDEYPRRGGGRNKGSS